LQRRFSHSKGLQAASNPEERKESTVTAARRGTTSSRQNAGGRKTSFRQQSISLARLAHLRENAYRALSQSFLSPTEDTLSAVADHLEEWTNASSIPGEFSFSTQLLRLHEICDGIDEQKLTRLQNRYVALFVTATGGVPCLPHESAYVAGTPGDEAQVLADIERDYATVGLYCSPAQKQPPDHISLELEFMAILCGREAEAWDMKEAKRAVRLLEKEHGFLDQHLGMWLPTFTRAVNAADAGGVYSRIGDALLAFVTHDSDLGEELADAFATSEGST
jgi:TorA maturation chaperone TorD